MYDITSKFAKNSPLPCWKGYERVPGTKRGAKGSCRKASPVSKKQKGGGTTKTCLPAAKIRSMSKDQRQKLVSAKRSSGAKGKYRRSSKTNVKGARPKGATLRDWFQKEDWRRVDDPSKKCGE
jgi:fructose-1,6-bisphosphatase/sedoheptulose 1,7-bisphosphatase-like protein